ncbi:MAG: FAD-dependent oxidoreductase [Chloroflexota bacterium]
MSDRLQPHSLAAVIGAGPAGLYAARKLAENGVRVVIFNRDIKPGGLAEYGIYPDKWKMKDGLRKQFRQILAHPHIDYYGNVRVCGCGSLTIEDLMASCFQAIVVATGAQGTKWLGLDGEYLHGVYHAKDLVYHYNRLPPFTDRPFAIGRRVALIGAGNVMMDIARWLIRTVKVEEVVAVVRRGPADVKFTKDEARNVARNFDLEAIEREFARVAPAAAAAGQSLAAARELFTASLSKALDPVSKTRFRFEFLASPKRVAGSHGRVIGLDVEDNTLVSNGTQTLARGLGTIRRLDVETVIFCIGDTVDGDFCLPIQQYGYAKVAVPRFPVNGVSFEAYDPIHKRPYDNIFLAGWARQASDGLVGVARKDGECAAEATRQFLHTLPSMPDPEADLREFEAAFEEANPQVVRKEKLPLLEAAEQAEAQRLGVPEFKFATNEEMLKVLGLA